MQTDSPLPSSIGKIVIPAHRFRREFEPMSSLLMAATLFPLVGAPLAFLTGGIIFAALKSLVYPMFASKVSADIRPLFWLCWSAGFALNCWVIWSSYQTRLAKFLKIEAKTVGREIVFGDDFVLISRRLGVYRGEAEHWKVKKLVSGETRSLGWKMGSAVPPDRLDESGGYIDLQLHDVKSVIDLKLDDPFMRDGIMVLGKEISVTILCYFDTTQKQKLLAAFQNAEKPIAKATLIRRGRGGVKMIFDRGEHVPVL